jgi:hypothetical protein
MPLEICKFSRHKRIKSVKKILKQLLQKVFVPHKTIGFMDINSWCLFCNWYFSFIRYYKSRSSRCSFFKNIKQQMSDCVLLGDRGYLSESIQLDLFQTVNIKLETPKRINQKDYKPQPYIFRKSRKRIETLFSQLCDQFMN